ncbi:hypothetical protein, conserved [Babesia bigemina]|uniref:Uncharacterized protein n=1 Tax=Babesia bigemina TaxID=5866 RepID=A0A061D843_BABBI|nr:hypothetical protein, conserved [Babesia bigemina]CDR93890.1 hypothetical protein, conserved [Babesia bigemina]|eukprot:XP_012766076.1 hypothetical protein, conserved [Babesia bigemina]
MTPENYGHSGRKEVTVGCFQAKSKQHADGLTKVMASSLEALKLAPSPAPRSVLAAFERPSATLPEHCYYCGAQGVTNLVPQISFNLQRRTATLVARRVGSMYTVVNAHQGACARCKQILCLSDINDHIIRTAMSRSKAVDEVYEHFLDVNDIRKWSSLKLQGVVLMRRRAARAAVQLTGSRPELSYGRFMGTEFYMSALKPKIVSKSGVVHCGLYSMKPCSPCAGEGIAHPPQTDIGKEPFNNSNSPPVSYKRAIDAAIHLAPALKGKRIPYRAREYLQRCLLEEAQGINISNILPLINATLDMRIMSESMRQVFLEKMEEMHRAPAGTTEERLRLSEAALLMLSLPGIQDLMATKYVELCLSILKSHTQHAPGDVRLRTGLLYASMLPSGLISLEDIRSIILTFTGNRDIPSHPMALNDCSAVVALLNVTRVYLAVRGKGWDSDPHGNEIKSYVTQVMIPQVVSNIYVFTAAHLTDVLSFFADTGLEAWATPEHADAPISLTHLLGGCCKRFVRDVSQFSISDMLSFHLALLRLNHRDEWAILALILVLPRRAQSLDSVEQLVRLLEFAHLAGIESQFLVEFASEQLMQLAHKIGRRHCQMLADLLSRRPVGGPVLLDSSALQALDSVGAKYGFNLLP